MPQPLGVQDNLHGIRHMHLAARAEVIKDIPLECPAQIENEET
jgi:hypothetical protein